MRLNHALSFLRRLMLGGLVCGLLQGPTMADHPAHSAHAGHAELPTAAFATDSLYHLTSMWTTASGQRLRLGNLRGKVQVLAMAYTTCEYACPLLVNTMQRLATEVPEELRGQVGFVLVTFDPERDIPEVLQAYGDKMRLDPRRWVLLHGQPDDVLELAVLLGVRYKKEPKGGFAHSNLITVLDEAGTIVYRHEGLYHPVEQTLTAIKKAARDSIGP
jgi:protein SCO1/2